MFEVSEVEPKLRGPKVHVSIVEHQGELVAHRHDPRLSQERLLASSKLPRHVWWLPSGCKARRG